LSQDELLSRGIGEYAATLLNSSGTVGVKNSNVLTNTISQIDYTQMAVVADFPAPAGPDCMDITADGKTILVASRWARKLSVIDIATRKVVRQVRVGKSPHGVWTLDHAPRF
jgi:YVTN family beta-propeller protein